jgi:hypothetical protein
MALRALGRQCAEGPGSAVSELLRSCLEPLHRPLHASAMDSLDAQCLLIQLAEGDLRAPDLWRHDRSGALSCGYERGELAFTWLADSVAELARTWRNSDTNQAPEQARLFVDAHQLLETLASEAGLGPADVIIHDLGRAEIRGRWEDEEVVLVIDEIGRSGFSASVP